MKKIFTLLACTLMLYTSPAQVILNELYTSPGGGKHEFFELYNSSPSSSPTSLAGYTVVSYFEESGGVKGFYVLDLPDLMIQPKSYLVGSSSNPFNFQGVSGSTSTQFSWNDIAFLNSNNGYLKKWVQGNAVPGVIDGNDAYDEQIVPANFNDFFYRIPGGGASYGVMIYKNGEVLSSFFGGESGLSVPSFISSMPILNVNVLGVGQLDFNFANIPSSSAEFVISDAGSDNGFIRNKDGLCGAWLKSSSSAQHTPNASNGAVSGEDASVTVWSVITKGYTTSDSATVSFKLLSAPADAFPVVLDLYVDNGTVPGGMDSLDTYVGTQTINDLSDTIFQQRFLPYNANILIAVKEVAGCYNGFALTPNTGYLLPLKVLHFTGLIENTGAKLQWSVGDNNPGSRFELEKSQDGITFQTVGIVFASQKSGTEQYSFKETAEDATGGYYRLKIEHADHSFSYSKVIKLATQGAILKKNIRLMNNPVDSYLGFAFDAATSSASEVSIYTMSGTKIYSTRIATQKGSNLITLNMGGRIYSGIYILEVRNGQDRTAVKFMKK